MLKLRGLYPALLASVVLGNVFVTNTSGETRKGFRFSGPEIFPIDAGINHLRTGDLDKDGLNDLIVVNNSRSRINLLFNRTGKPLTKPKAKAGTHINELPPDARFEIDSIASEKRIAGFVAQDLNGDQIPDLAYFGEPRELVVHYSSGPRQWDEIKRWTTPEAHLSQNGLTHGDLNNDGKTDLLLLAEGYCYRFIQGKEGLDSPDKFPFSGAVKAIQSLDLNHDKKDDLLLVDWDSKTPFRFRLQTSNGQFGPETYMDYPMIRSYWADDLDANGTPEVVAISQFSGRAQLLQLEKAKGNKNKKDFSLGSLSVLPITRTSKSTRGQAWADLNGDSKTDLISAEPDSGQITINLQSDSGDLEEGKSFPSFTGVTQLLVNDWGGKEGNEIFVFSPDERTVGVTQLNNKGRIPFPETISVEGRPLFITTGLLGDGHASLIIVTDIEGKRHLEIHTAKGRQYSTKLADSFRGTPRAMLVHDTNQDGLQDIIILVPYEKARVLVQKNGGEYEEVEVDPPGGNSDRPWLTILDVDQDGKDEVLFAQKNFLRAVILEKKDKDWRFRVKDQINGASSRSMIAGATTLKDEAGTVRLFLLDTTERTLTISKLDDTGVWRIEDSVDLPLTSFTGLNTISIGSDRPNSIALNSANFGAWMQVNEGQWQLAEKTDYATPIQDGMLMDVVSGDLNHDGIKDLVFMETGKNHLDVVQFTKKGELKPGNHWRVFEEKSFRSRRSMSPEPRESVIGDVTGDKRNDLIILVHDRILLYPQM